MKHNRNPIYIPKDENVFSWDPENMETYWQQCNLYDYYPLSNSLLSESLLHEQKSLNGFRHFSIKDRPDL